MKTYRQFIEEAIEAGKEMVVHTGRLKEIPNEIPDEIPNDEDESEKREVIQGVYEQIVTPEDVPVHEHLSNHSDPEGLVRGIMSKMESSDQELIEKHNFHTEEGVREIVKRLKDPNYHYGIVQQFMKKYGRKDGSP